MSAGVQDQTPTRLSRATLQAVTREWGLFSDWCASWDLDPLPTSADVVTRFLQAFSAAKSTQAVRVRAIRHHHRDAGVPLDLKVG